MGCRGGCRPTPSHSSPRIGDHPLVDAAARGRPGSRLGLRRSSQAVLGPATSQPSRCLVLQVVTAPVHVGGHLAESLHLLRHRLLVDCHLHPDLLAQARRRGRGPASLDPGAGHIGDLALQLDQALTAVVPDAPARRSGSSRSRPEELLGARLRFGERRSGSASARSARSAPARSSIYARK